jgi:hypothetical protein
MRTQWTGIPDPASPRHPRSVSQIDLIPMPMPMQQTQMRPRRPQAGMTWDQSPILNPLVSGQRGITREGP